MTNERKDILSRVLNLRALAESSESESEAMNAMKVADRLMRGYRIEEAELALAEGLGEIKVEIVDVKSERNVLKQGRNRHKVSAVIWAIERYCEVEAVTYDRSGQYRVIGDKPDVELFEYLVALCRDALDREYVNWKRTQQAVGRGAKPAFQLAMARRIGARLQDMIDERNADREQAIKDEAKLLNKDADQIRASLGNGNLRELTSTALVMVGAAQQKREAVQAAYQKAYKNVRLGTASGFAYRGGGSASAAGAAAGNRVGLGRPVGGSAAGRIGAC